MKKHIELNRNQTVKRAIIGLFVSICLIILDQVTKMFAVSSLKGKDAFIIWDGVFELRYLENRGAAFGMMQGQKVWFVLFTSVAMTAIVWFYLKKIPAGKRYRFLDVLCVLLFSGAAGNFIDRIRLDYVVDFFYFVLIDFPIFNVADIYVTVAAAGMIILGLFYYKDEDYELIFPSGKEKVKKNAERNL